MSDQFRFPCWVDFVACEGVIETTDVDIDYDGVRVGECEVDSMEEDLELYS